MLKVCVVLCALSAVSAAAAEESLICFGNKPSWSVDLTTPGAARVSFLGDTATEYRGGETRLDHLRERVWRGKPSAGAGGDLVAFLSDAACSDTMSDVKHPVTARVSLPDGKFLAGCCRAASGGAASAASAAKKTLEGVSWRLTSLTGKDPKALAGLSRPATARFEAGRVSGFSGCNNFMGSYTVEGDLVKLGQLAGTMMACPEPQMAFDDAFRAAFSGTVRYAIAGEELSLFAESGAVLAFKAEVPRLEGVTWDVTGYNNNRHAVVSPVAGTRITFSFADGTASGNAGCNTFRAPYSAKGNGIKVGPAATTRMACAKELMTQEQEFLAALESAVRWSVEGGQLDMHRADEERAIFAIVKK